MQAKKLLERTDPFFYTVQIDDDKKYVHFFPQSIIIEGALIALRVYSNLKDDSQHDELEPNCKKNLHRYEIWSLVADVM